LCVNNKSSGVVLNVLMMILPIVVCMLLVYGINNICENFTERKIIDKSQKRFKRGIDCTIWSFIILVFSCLIIIIGKGIFHDPCGNKSVSFSVFEAMLRINQIFVPLALLIKGFSSIIILICHRTNSVNKKDIKKKIIIYIVSAVLIFLLLTLFDAILGLVTNGSNDGNWAQCWCD